MHMEQFTTHLLSAIYAIFITDGHSVSYILQHFDTVGWASGRASCRRVKNLSDVVLVWLSVWSEG